MTKRSTWSASFLIATMCACGPAVDHRETLSALRSAINRTDAPAAGQDSRAALAVRVVEEGALDRMRRDQVIAAIGHGDTCSRHPFCAERNFEDDDWVYTLGEDTNAPSIIVGFDDGGVVMRTTYITRARASR